MQHNLVTQLEQILGGVYPHEHWRNKTFVLALSGGADSVALLRLMVALNTKLYALHVNYKQRGLESEEDERFVQGLCATLKVPLTVITWPHGKGLASFQEKARDFRYQALEEWRVKWRADHILTAHHIQDRAETILYNLVRGSGLKGLSALAFRNGYVLRPLLDMQKQVLTDYLTALNQTWREDSSNHNDRYDRNLIRHRILPEFTKLHPSAIKNMGGAAQRLQMAQVELEHFYKSIFEQHAEISLDTASAKVWCLNLETLQNKLKDVHSFFAFFLSLLGEERFHSEQIERLAGLSQNPHPEAKIVSLPKLRIEFFKDKLYAIRGQMGTKEKRLHSLDDFIGHLKNSGFSVSEDKNFQSFEKDKMYINSQSLSFPLCIRQVKDGDYFTPFKMQNKRKKIADLLKEWHYAPWQKESAEICVNADETIIFCDWKRHSERIAAQTGSENVLIIESNTYK